MTTKKCPRCGSKDFLIECKVTAYLLYTVIDGIVEANGYDMDAGTELGNTCICSNCRHIWHPRNFDYTIDS